MLVTSFRARSFQIVSLVFLLGIFLFTLETHAQVYSLSVTPMGTYDSRWDGTSYGAVGSNGYMRDVNGAPVLTTVWETSFDSIWSQAGVDLVFETQQNLDLNDYVGSMINPVNVLNFQNTTQEQVFRTAPNPRPNPALEADLSSFTSTTGSSNTHYVLFTNSYSNGGPINTDFNNPAGPLAGGLSGFSASGIALTPSPGDSLPGRLRTNMATGSGVTAANAAGFNNASGLPTVLAHELGHNGSLPHLNTGTTSEHYDPTRSDALMWTGGGGTGSRNVMTAGEVADALRTMDNSGTLAIAAGQFGTFWDTNGATAGYGGSGTWDGAATNWGRPSGTGATGAWAGSEVAVFRAAGAYNVTVSGTQTATGIAVQAGDVTFNGGTINLTNAKSSVDGKPEIFVESTRTATINSVISGGGGEALTKLGAGTLVLTGANTYTGGNQIRRGTLRGNDTSIQGNVEMVNGSDTTISTVLEFNQSANGTFAGNITGDGDEVRKTAAGVLNLTSSTLSYSGMTNVNAGTLNINGTKSGTGAVFVAAGASLGGTGSIAGNTTVLGSLDLNNVAADVLNFTNDLTLDFETTTFLEFTASGVADKVDVTGLLTFDGEIMFTNLGYSFATNDSFDLFDWGSVSFTAFDVAADLFPNLPTLNGGLMWDTSSFTTNGTVFITGVPEPGSMVLLGLFACGAMARRTRRSRSL